MVMGWPQCCDYLGHAPWGLWLCGTLGMQLACAQAREPEVEGGNSKPSVCVSECLQAGVYLVHIWKFTAWRKVAIVENCWAHKCIQLVLDDQTVWRPYKEHAACSRTTYKKAMPHITWADTNFMWATMTEIQLLCESRTHNMKLVYHINNKSSAHGLTVADEIPFLTRKGRHK